MDFFSKAAEILASFTECLLIPGTVIAACGAKHGKKKTLCLLLVFASIYTLYVASMNAWTAFSFITPTGGMFMTIFVAGKWLSNGSLTLRSISCVLAFFMIQSVDYILFFGMALLQGNLRQFFFDSLLPGLPRICYLAINKGCDVLLFCLFRKHLKRLSELRHKVMAGLLACTLLAYGTMQYLFAMVLYGDYIQLQRTFWVSFFILLCFLIILIYSMVTVTASEKEKATNQMLANMNQIMESNYSIVNESITNKAKALHDFHHHLSVIDSLARKGESRQIAEYVRSVQTTSLLPTQLCRCGNHIIDAVINTKLSEAQQKGVHVDYKISIADLSSFEQADICAILANQIENAFDACESMPQARSVQIRIQQQENFVLFKVSNSVPSDPFLTNKNLISTKPQDAQIHGLGLRNIQDIAKKYNGSMKNEYVDGFFVSTVLICGRAT